ncbi:MULTISPECIES: rod shape-determining protein MreC [Acinetobacter]|uniref:Cell shape-determining protein MreC n=2 Tax=Acinetobacter haemolyticus TaxID=29430 RepID=A0A2K8PZ41_ACIHA|nr:rod shape-determining protein MreC [Acinetobacter haemolyticus]ATZ67998.1 rod shape-determining protein MreC [Acinetobacter haemolyticus]AZN68279.1 rod shape-determining protein MreC [Acinetobacter haemolyticus]ENW17214.1 rod shape-determining protein MreC [Acinetobacter haemolyticus CIP 64.3 = MTCC 9819]ENW21742.1 rod shape-determining protein MreC [Acinetobacter haemolyticus NIPH 261]MBO3658391.1 rod shape-determining protein MreC [Acinetobacter haemolyticus]
MQPNLFSRQPPSFRSFVIAVITCLVVLFFDWRMPHVIKPARDVLYAAYNPIYALASYPVLSREWLNQQTKSEAQLRRENTAMQAELLQARVRLQKLSELSAENNRLRGLLDTPLIIDGRMQIAEVIGTDADPLRHIIIINRGSADQLKIGQTVLDDQGIMGQIINVYPHSARVMLLSDKEHSLSVRLERTGMRAIVSGTGDLGQLKMDYVATSANIKVGDKVFSSGLGEHFPAGYLVGTVSKVSRHNSGEFAEIDVVPAAQLASGHHVVVLFSESLAKEQPYANR